MSDAKKAAESIILHGDWIPGSSEVAGSTFDFGGVSIRFDGVVRRQVWSDQEDGWVWRHAPAYSFPGSAAARAVPLSRYAIQADGGKGYYAIAGKVASSAATNKAHKATVFASRAEAEAALPAIAEAAPGFFGPKQDAVVVAID